MKFYSPENTLRISYSFTIIAIYLSMIILKIAPFLAFLITLNIFYFSWKLLLYYLSPETTTNNKNVNITINQSEIIPQHEQEFLPFSIKQLFLKTTVQPISTNNVQTIQMNTQRTTDTEKLTQSEEILLTAMQKAERMIEEKINELKSKKTIKKDEVIEEQKMLKEKIIKELPNVPALQEDEVWIQWVPDIIDEHILNQAIYCEKCQKAYLAKEMIYEVQNKENYYELKTIHSITNENHVNTTRIAPEKYEILSKPILTIEAHESLQEVEA